MEDEKEKNTSPVDYEDLRDWEYDGEGIKRQKKAYHLKWVPEESDNKKEE